MANIVQAMKSLNISRVLGLSGAGVLDSPNGGLRRDQPDFPPFFRAISEQHLAGLQAMRGSELDWTMVCTGDIRPGDRTAVYRCVDDQFPEGARFISVEDVANFMLGEVTGNQHLRRRVGLGY
jgi:putative NADH-flavin reductase